MRNLHPYNPNLPYRERAEIYPMRRGSILTGLLHGGKVPATFGGGVDPGETDFGEAAARELLEETGWKARNVRPAGLDPIVMEWDDKTQLTDKHKERRKDFRGERTHMFVGDVYAKTDPSDPSSFAEIKFRRPSTLLKLIEEYGKDNVYQKTHSEFFKRLLDKKAAYKQTSATAIIKRAYGGSFDNYEYDRYTPALEANSVQDLLKALAKSNDVAQRNKQKIKFYSNAHKGEHLPYDKLLPVLQKALAGKEQANLNDLPLDVYNQLPWFYSLEYPTKAMHKFNKRHEHPVSGMAGYDLPVQYKDKLVFRHIQPKLADV